VKVNAGRDQNSLSKSLVETLLFHGTCLHHTGAPKGLFQAPCKYPEEVTPLYTGVVTEVVSQGPK